MFTTFSCAIPSPRSSERVMGHSLQQAEADRAQPSRLYDRIEQFDSVKGFYVKVPDISRGSSLVLELLPAQCALSPSGEKEVLPYGHSREGGTRLQPDSLWLSDSRVSFGEKE